MERIMQMNLYEFIGAEPTASVQEIKKAYRKKALTCHPDKNPDNPRAAELFHDLSKALEILIDTSARAAYDKVLIARKQAKERVREFDAKRKKFKEDLEAREEAYRKIISSKFDDKSDDDRLKAEIARLEKEGSKQVEEEIAFVQRQIWEQLHSSCKNSNSKVNVGEYRIKITWKVEKDDTSNGGYNYDNLHTMFSKHGDVTALVVSSAKKGRAIVEFGNESQAETALEIETGLFKNPLTLRPLWDKSKPSIGITSRITGDTTFKGFSSTINKSLNSKPCSSVSFPSAPDIFTQQNRISDAEFESAVLANLRRAEERKRLIEELKAEDKT